MTIKVNHHPVTLVKVNGTVIDHANANGTLVWSNNIAPGRVSNFAGTTNQVNKITFTWTNTAVGKPVPTYDLYQGGHKIATNIHSPHVFATTDHVAHQFHVNSHNIVSDVSSNIVSAVALAPDVPITHGWGNKTISVRYMFYAGDLQYHVPPMWAIYTLIGNGHHLHWTHYLYPHSSGEVLYNATTHTFSGINLLNGAAAVIKSSIRMKAITGTKIGYEWGNLAGDGGWQGHFGNGVNWDKHTGKFTGEACGDTGCGALKIRGNNNNSISIGIFDQIKKVWVWSPPLHFT